MSNSNPQKLRSRIKDHFEDIAGEYDNYKNRASYYYDQLKRLLREILPDSQIQNIIEIGCGTGSVLAFLNPKKGLGVDISKNMIDRARSTWQHLPSLTFMESDAETIRFSNEWDAIIMADVLEHLYDKEAAIKVIANQMPDGCKLILTWANPIWSPVLEVLERLKMKMPEGPHQWDSRDTMKKMLSRNGLIMVREGTRCIVPARIPCADFINEKFYKIPVLRKLGLICFLICQKSTAIKH